MNLPIEAFCLNGYHGDKITLSIQEVSDIFRLRVQYSGLAKSCRNVMKDWMGELNIISCWRML